MSGQCVAGRLVPAAVTVTCHAEGSGRSRSGHVAVGTPPKGRQRLPIPAEYSYRIRRSRPGGLPSPPTGGGVWSRPATGARCGISRLAATTAGPRLGAGSRPRRRRRGRFHPVSCPGEAGQRTASVDRAFALPWVARACQRGRANGFGSLVSSSSLLVALLVLARSSWRWCCG